MLDLDSASPLRFFTFHGKVGEPNKRNQKIAGSISRASPTRQHRITYRITNDPDSTALPGSRIVINLCCRQHTLQKSGGINASVFNYLICNLQPITHHIPINSNITISQLK
jgi:hypothetical protein